MLITSLIFAVTIRLYRSGARWPLRSEPAVKTRDEQRGRRKDLSIPACGKTNPYGFLIPRRGRV
jgi:hypothetical protein